MYKTILVVDDQPSALELFQDYLQEYGYRIVSASDGREALARARQSKPDIILLDIMMPNMDGYEFIRQFRQERKTPIIFVTARAEESDAVLSLELGGDDFVTKPIRMRELIARIRAVIRRYEDNSEKAEVYQAGDLVLDVLNHNVFIRDTSIYLTPIEFNLLRILMRSRGKVFSRSELAYLLGESDFAGIDRTINVHIRNLRAKIEPDLATPTYIQTVFGIGYSFSKG